MIKKNDLINYFENGFKSTSDLRIGTEHEKFFLNKSPLKPKDYFSSNGIKDLFENLIKFHNWKPKFDSSNNIIALNKFNKNITLEPGGQIELSGEPLENIHQTCNEIYEHLNELKTFSQMNNFVLLGIGVEPKFKRNQFSWVPKDRYQVMKKYMPKVGNNGLDMMLRTASTQTSFDYISEIDLIKKFRVLLSIESLVNAIFANSPFLEGKLTSYKSLRSVFWKNTDINRTGILSFVFDDNFNIESYVDYALNVPMYFVIRKNRLIDATNFTFKDFMNGNHKSLFPEEPTIDDWDNHLTTIFTQVRLKKYLEVRSMDACSWREVCSQPAFLTGILYNNDSLDEAYKICSDWTNEDRLYLYNNVPKYGLDTKFKKGKLIDFAKFFLNLSLDGLKKRNIISSSGKDERQYLKSIEENLSNSNCPADILINNFKNQWERSIDPIYEENIF